MEICYYKYKITIVFYVYIGGIMHTLNIIRLFVEPNQSYFLFGPRGTGKSTLMQKQHSDALMINLLSTKTRFDYMANPE